MPNLISIVISILLVVVLAISAAFYGGDVMVSGKSKALAATLANQAVQIHGASILYKSDHGEWPASMDVLVANEHYLRHSPIPPGESYAAVPSTVSPVPSAYADNNVAGAQLSSVRGRDYYVRAVAQGSIPQALLDKLDKQLGQKPELWERAAEARANRQPGTPSPLDFTWSESVTTDEQSYVLISDKINEQTCAAVNLAARQTSEIPDGPIRTASVQCYSTPSGYSFLYIYTNATEACSLLESEGVPTCAEPELTGDPEGTGDPNYPTTCEVHLDFAAFGVDGYDIDHYYDTLTIQDNDDPPAAAKTGATLNINGEEHAIAWDSSWNAWRLPLPLPHDMGRSWAYLTRADGSVCRVTNPPRWLEPVCQLAITPNQGSTTTTTTATLTGCGFTPDMVLTGEYTNEFNWSNVRHTLPFVVVDSTHATVTLPAINDIITLRVSQDNGVQNTSWYGYDTEVFYRIEGGPTTTCAASFGSGLTLSLAGVNRWGDTPSSYISVYDPDTWSSPPFNETPGAYAGTYLTIGGNTYPLGAPQNWGTAYWNATGPFPSATAGVSPVYLYLPNGDVCDAGKVKYVTQFFEVDGINPGEGSHAGGTLVVVNGRGFDPGVTGRIRMPDGSEQSLPLNYVSSTEATVLMPAAPRGGYAELQFANPDGQTGSAGYNYTLGLSLSPAHGPAEGGYQVKLILDSVDAADVNGAQVNWVWAPVTGVVDGSAVITMPASGRPLGGDTVEVLADTTFGQTAPASFTYARAVQPNEIYLATDGMLRSFPDRWPVLYTNPAHAAKLKSGVSVNSSVVAEGGFALTLFGKNLCGGSVSITSGVDTYTAPLTCSVPTVHYGLQSMLSSIIVGASNWFDEFSETNQASARFSLFNSPLGSSTNVEVTFADGGTQQITLSAASYVVKPLAINNNWGTDQFTLVGGYYRHSLRNAGSYNAALPNLAWLDTVTFDEMQRIYWASPLIQDGALGGYPSYLEIESEPGTAVRCSVPRVSLVAADSSYLYIDYYGVPAHAVYGPNPWISGIFCQVDGPGQWRVRNVMPSLVGGGHEIKSNWVGNTTPPLAEKATNNFGFSCNYCTHFPFAGVTVDTTGGQTQEERQTTGGKPYRISTVGAGRLGHVTTSGATVYGYLSISVPYVDVGMHSSRASSSLTTVPESDLIGVYTAWVDWGDGNFIEVPVTAASASGPSGMHNQTGYLTFSLPPDPRVLVPGSTVRVKLVFPDGTENNESFIVMAPPAGHWGGAPLNLFNIDISDVQRWPRTCQVNLTVEHYSAHLLYGNTAVPYYNSGYTLVVRRTTPLDTDGRFTEGAIDTGWPGERSRFHMYWDEQRQAHVLPYSSDGPQWNSSQGPHYAIMADGEVCNVTPLP